MVTPKWVETRCQPIAVRDVLRYLVASATLPPEVDRAFDIGGPDVLTYADMMQTYARASGLRPRVIVPVPVLSPTLSSHWVGLVTPLPRSLARPLVNSLVNEGVEPTSVELSRVANEIQLGMLKRLRGTPIVRHTVEHGMVYEPGPPYTVQQTHAVNREDMQRFARLARYWDLIANSGRFAQTLAWLLEPSSTTAESNSLQAEPISVRAEPVEALSPFNAFLRFSDWLWRTTSKTSNFPPEALVDALFDYLTTAQQLEPAAARQLLLADYLKSGARASPRSLKGLLPRPAGQAGRAALPNTRRQLRHEPSDLANSP